MLLDQCLGPTLVGEAVSFPDHYDRSSGCMHAGRSSLPQRNDRADLDAADPGEALQRRPVQVGWTARRYDKDDLERRSGPLLPKPRDDRPDRPVVIRYQNDRQLRGGQTFTAKCMTRGCTSRSKSR
jgi:hypothetical protein